MTLTVSDVSYRGNKLFDTSRRTIETAVANGISTQDQQLFHVWLTRKPVQCKAHRVKTLRSSKLTENSVGG